MIVVVVIILLMFKWKRKNMNFKYIFVNFFVCLVENGYVVVRVYLDGCFVVYFLCLQFGIVVYYYNFVFENLM